MLRFHEFINFLLDKDMRYDDEHWMPYYKFCTPCNIDYSFIGKVCTPSNKEYSFIGLDCLIY